MARNLRIWVAVKHGVDVGLARADPTTGTVPIERAPRKTSDFDRNAIEEAVRIREKLGGSVTAVSVGPAASKEALREAMAIGADEAVLLTEPSAPSVDSRTAARVLAAHARHSDGFDLWLFGEGSTDHFSGTVGPRVAAELGVASLSYVRRLSVEESAVLAERDLEGSVEKVRAAFPAIVTVGQEINTPRLPTFMSTLKASKKEIRQRGSPELGLSAADWVPLGRIQRAFVPETPRRRTPVAGTTPDEVAAALLAALRTEGVLE